MSIYLYVKTHNLTNLKYLGQTTSSDPHRYTGSGIYWKSHLKKHGSDYRTEILRICETKEEVKEWGLFYSKLWNVVESEDWANLKVEQGDGGRQSEEVRKRIGEAGRGRVPWNKGKSVWSEADRKRISEQNRARPPQSKETIEKRVSKNRGKVRSDEAKKKTSDALKGRKFTDESRKKMSEAAKRRCARRAVDK